MKLKGVWLPIITPFHNGEIDYKSYKNLINHYMPKGISGLIPLGTTGESPTISEYEYDKLVDVTLETVNGRLPVYIGYGGNYTAKLVSHLNKFDKKGIKGILSVCPYYNRPNQQGLYQHYLKISEATPLNIIIYNIPYRTGVNLLNETLYKLAELKNIVAVKDSSGDVKQSLDLLSNRPDNLSILTGEDILFYMTITHGGDGGIMASSHLNTEIFIEVYDLVGKNDHKSALKKWTKLFRSIPLLFKEPNPAPIKYCLKQKQLIQSAEVRLPLIEISNELQNQLKNSYTDLSPRKG